MQRAYPRRSKYNAKLCIIDGKRFASQKEGRRYHELRLLEMAGKIFCLETQVRYPIKVNTIIVCTYIADFTYLDCKKNLITEDTKGFKTPEYKLKKKLMKAVYDIDILET